MFDRPDNLPRWKYESKEMKLMPGDSPEAAFQAWCTDTHFCTLHQRTELVLVQKDSDFRPVYENPHGSEPLVIPGEFHFRAKFNCPSCLMAYALCPPEFHETSFKTFDTSTTERAFILTKARELAAQMNTHSCGFGLFVGPTGPGKTRLACNMIGDLEHLDSLYARQAELTAALRSTYRPHRVEYDKYGREIEQGNPLKITQNVRLLVLDEIGCTALANDERLLLDELIKHRYELRKPTILISNLPLVGTSEKPGLKEFLGDALTDRIQEATGNGKFIVQFTGGSYRRSTGENYLDGLGQDFHETSLWKFLTGR